MLQTVPGTFIEHFVSVISGWYLFYNKWHRPVSMRAVREGLLEEKAFNVRPEKWEWSKHVNNWGSKSQRQKKEHLVSPRGRKEISGERGWRMEHGMSWGSCSRQPGKEFGFYSSRRVGEWRALCFKKSHSAAVQRINCKGEAERQGKSIGWWRLWWEGWRRKVKTCGWQCIHSPDLPEQIPTNWVS